MAGRSRRFAPFSLFAFQDIITSVTGIMILVTLTLSLELLQRKESSPPRKTAEIASDVRSAVAANEAEIDNLRRRLAARQSAMMQVAGIDKKQVLKQLTSIQELNNRLDKQLSAFAREHKDAQQRLQSAEEEENRRAADPQTVEELLREAEKKTRQIERLKRSNRTIFRPSPNAAKTPWLVEVTAGKMVAAPWGKSAPPTTVHTAAELKNLAARRDRKSEYFVLLIKPDGIEMFARARQALKSAGFDVGFDLLTADQTAVDLQTGAAAQ